MIQAIKFLGGLQLGTSTADIYAGLAQPLNAKVKVTTIWICNTDSSVRALTIRFGVGSLTAANSLFNACPVEGNRTWVIKDPEGVIILDAGMKVQGFADSAAKVNVFLYGAEVT